MFSYFFILYSMEYWFLQIIFIISNCQLAFWMHEQISIQSHSTVIYFAHNFSSVAAERPVQVKQQYGRRLLVLDLVMIQILSDLLFHFLCELQNSYFYYSYQM
jgi:hypothetical protein